MFISKRHVKMRQGMRYATGGQQMKYVPAGKILLTWLYALLLLLATFSFCFIYSPSALPLISFYPIRATILRNLQFSLDFITIRSYNYLH